MAIDLRGHTVPSGTDSPKRSDLNALSLSINATKTVANMTEAAQYITALTAASLPTTAAMIYNTADKGVHIYIDGAFRRMYTQFDDTAWKPIPGAPNNGTYQYRVVYGIIAQVQSRTIATFGANGTNFPLYQVPPGIRPTSTVPMAAYGASGYPATAHLSSSGNVNVRNNHSAAVGEMILSATYLLG